MKYLDMESIGHHGNHVVAPKAWREVPNLTGDADCDATIAHRSNTDMPARLNLYIRRGNSQGPGTGYNSYHGYSKDN
jgi:hypothetical protein